MKRALVALAIGAAVCAKGPPPAPMPLGFSPEVVGAFKVEPVAPGDYAMALRMRFSVFLTTELEISKGADGVLKLSLLPDGGATACAGLRTRDVVAGQWRYQPAEKRQHREDEQVTLMGLSGRWSAAAGIAAVTFDTVAYGGCDPRKGTTYPTTQAELRCVGRSATAQVPVAGLGCEAKGELMPFGLPMGADAGVTHARDGRAPAGGHLLLGAPGVRVEVSQERADAPTFTFAAEPVVLNETAFRPKPTKPR